MQVDKLQEMGEDFGSKNAVHSHVFHVPPDVFMRHRPTLKTGAVVIMEWWSKYHSIPRTDGNDTNHNGHHNIFTGQNIHEHSQQPDAVQVHKSSFHQPLIRSAIINSRAPAT